MIALNMGIYGKDIMVKENVQFVNLRRHKMAKLHIPENIYKLMSQETIKIFESRYDIIFEREKE